MYLRLDLLGKSERELGDGTTDPPLDSLRTERHLVVARSLSPLLGAIGIADGHPYHGDRRMDTSERDDSGNAAAGPDDDLPADLLPQDSIRRADVADALRRDRRGLEPVSVLADRCGRLVDHAVGRSPSRLEREVEARELEVDPGHVRSKHAQRLVEELLACLVSFENDDNPHVAILLAGSSLENARSLCTCNSAS